LRRRWFALLPTGDASRAAEYLRSLLEGRESFPPRAAVVLGSGLSGACPALDKELEVPFEEVPGWPESSVPGHRGCLRFGSRDGRGVLVQLGRLHYYEGHDMATVTLPVQVMHLLGVERVLLTNAAGGLNPTYLQGSLMLVRDHINLMGENPLRGVKDPSGRPVFLDLSRLYREDVGDRLVQEASAMGVELYEGVLVAMAGPTYETPAELRFLRVVGGDAVSMSLVPEAIVAHYLGMAVTGISVITNVWDLRRPLPLSHGEVLEAAESAAAPLAKLIEAWLDAGI